MININKKGTTLIVSYLVIVVLLILGFWAVHFFAKRMAAKG